MLFTLRYPIDCIWLRTCQATSRPRNSDTDGSIRASHSKTGKPPYDNLGLPYQSHLLRDVEPVPGDRVIKIEFDILPIYYRNDPGHRIRVTVAGADADNAIRPPNSPLLRIKLYHTPAHLSGVSLPVKDDKDP